jgi:hypothetical protein
VAGTDVGNGRATLELQVRAYEGALVARSQNLSDGARIDELWMVMGRLRLRAGTDTECEDSDDAVDIEGPVVIDLLGESSPQSPLRIEGAAGTYCRLRLAFSPVPPDEVPAGAPADLADMSIVMRGVRADGTAFEVLSDVADEYRLDSKEGGFELPEGVTPMLLAYELGEWMTALDLDALSGDPIRVDKTDNPEALEAFEAAVKRSARLFRDGDEDGEVDADETADELAAGEEQE